MAPLLLRRGEHASRSNQNGGLRKSEVQAGGASDGGSLRGSAPGNDLESGEKTSGGLWRVFALARPERTMIVIGTVALLLSAVANIALVRL